jgi:riboflavin kinase/FMN adenylyltransferase
MRLCTAKKQKTESETEHIMMQIFSHIETLPDENGCAVAMGYFDGLHIGHRAVIGTAVEWAAKHNASPAVFTFSLPRENSLKGGRLLDTQKKHEAAEKMGVTYYTAPAFDEFKDLSPEEFIDALIGKMHAKALCCGDNFTFGAKAAGNVELLQKLCPPRGVEVIVVPTATYEGKTVSSTRIRTALSGGDIPSVNAMLGQPYTVHFPVQHGAGLGRTLGFPTINQIFPLGYQLPRYGIYITRTRINGAWYPSATGLGTRPTVNDNPESITCETFIADFEGNLYGDSPEVAFYAYLAPSRKFDTLDELKGCIRDAAAQAKAYFAAK